MVGKEFASSKLKMVDNHFTLAYTGFINIQYDGLYKFYLTSDDGSRLLINDQLVVDNDGDHGPETKSGEIKLKKGKYAFRIDYFENIGGELLKVEYEGPSLEKQEVPFSILSN